MRNSTGAVKKYSQRVPNIRQKLVTQVAVVHQFSLLSQFAERSLKNKPVGSQILQQTLPPVRAFVDDLVEFCLGYAIAPTRLNEHVTPYTSITKSRSERFRQFLTFAGRALIDCDDRHEAAHLTPFSEKTLFSDSGVCSRQLTTPD